MSPSIPRLSLSSSLAAKELCTNYDASLMFQDAVVKSTIFLFSPVPVIPDTRQRVRAVPGFGFGGREEEGERIGMSQ